MNTQGHEIGFLTASQDYLLYIEGLPSARVNDVIVSSSGNRALVTGLTSTRIEALMLDKLRPAPGEIFTLEEGGLRLPLGVALLGRTINPLGQPLDGKAGFPPSGKKTDLDAVAPGIAARKIIDMQLYTGITMVDTLLPLGKGQRELIFGEPRSGKSSFLLDIIINQKNKNTICIYTALGRSEVDVKRFTKRIGETGAQKYTTIIAATSSDSAPLIAIAPSVACAIAEHFVLGGWDVLLIFDDFGAHAKYLREIGLLSGRIPGRESYPADIFYAHSHLVERAGNFNETYGNASITLLPVIETDLENFTNLIPTNVMAMTDGHLLFSASLRAQGLYPAIDPDRSVTRVGHQTQKPLHKLLADKIRSLLADFHELERYGRFGSELTAQTQVILKQGTLATELLKQEAGQFIDPLVQILLLSLIFTAFFNNRDVEFVRAHKEKIIKTLSTHQYFSQIKVMVGKDDFAGLILFVNDGIRYLEEACQ